jgi:flagellar protein FlaG
MSFDIGSVQGVHAAAAPVRSTNRPSASGGTQTASEAVKVDVSGIPSSPPSEVLDAMGTASNVYDQLAAKNRGLSFKIDDATGKVVVAVHDLEGKVLFTVPASKALDIASGGSLDG